ncbi:MAG: hypothetical protein ACM34M_07300 [Ignavibacteria bacterium]
MVPDLRKRYNAAFSRKNYEAFLNDLNKSKIFSLALPISETPLFLTDDLTEKLINASNKITAQMQTDEFKKYSEPAVPEMFFVPNEDEHPLFFLLDFAVCRNEKGFIPMLIEMQGFPSHFFFMSLLEEKYRDYFPVPENLTTYFSGLNRSSYRDLMKNILLDGSDPENTILLEVEPEKQKSRAEFGCTLESTGITPVNLSSIIKRKNKLYYKKNGKEIPVHKIYNRVIQDEVVRKNVQFDFKFTDELDVKWIGHPNWFFKISKYSLPFLKSEFVPPAFFLNNNFRIPDDLENYVLKPLFSYSGQGVEIDVSKEMIERIENKSDYILQKKIEYSPLVLTPDGFLKAEIRMIYVWPFKEKKRGEISQPILVNNLVRMGKGKMMGIDYNRNQTWAGMTTAYHALTF